MWYIGEIGVLLDEMVPNGVRGASHSGGKVEGSSNLTPHSYPRHLANNTTQTTL